MNLRVNKYFHLYCFILYLIHLVSCSSQEKDLLIGKEMVQDYYYKKSLYCSKTISPIQVDSFRIGFIRSFEKMRKNKEVVIDFLFQCEFDLSSSFYDEVVDYPPSWGARNSNFINSMYLIESIMANDPIFNRRGILLNSLRAKLRCEELNTVYDTTKTTPISTVQYFALSCEGQKYLEDCRAAWGYYSSWYKSGGIDKKVFISPLSGTKLKWNSI